jgi:hypothetical protein
MQRKESAGGIPLPERLVDVVIRPQHGTLNIKFIAHPNLPLYSRHAARWLLLCFDGYAHLAADMERTLIYWRCWDAESNRPLTTPFRCAVRLSLRLYTQFVAMRNYTQNLRIHSHNFLSVV